MKHGHAKRTAEQARAKRPMPPGHKEPGLFVSEEAMVGHEPITPELEDHADLDIDEELDTVSPVSPLEDPREA